MNKGELFLVMVLLIADVFGIMSLSIGGTISKFWMDVLLFTNGLAIGDILYTVFLQETVKSMFKKE